MIKRYAKYYGSLVCLALFGCSGADTTGLPAILSTIPYQALHLNAGAIMMSTVAPYDTLQLAVTAVDGTGQPIALRGTVTYTVSDTTLTVSPTGLLTAKHESLSEAGTTVVATLQDTTLNVTHTDTAYVLVTTTVPTVPLATYSIHQLAPGDSAIRDVGGTDFQILVTATDAMGQTVPSVTLPAHFISLNPFIATVDPLSGDVVAKNPGSVLLTASLAYYGVVERDSLRLTIGWTDLTPELFSQVTLANGQKGAKALGLDIILMQGKSIFFSTTTLPGFDIVFDDPSAAQPSPDTLSPRYNTGSGNVGPITIPAALFDSVSGNVIQPYPLVSKYCNPRPLPSPCSAVRMFPTVGTFKWHSTLLGLNGTITVLPRPSY